MLNVKSIISAATLCCFLAACLPAKPPPCMPEDIRQGIRVLALKPSREAPNIQFGKIIKSRGEGSSKGAASGALGTLNAAGQTGDPLAAAMAVLMLPVFTVGGAIYGAASSDSAKTVPIKLDTIKGKLTASDIQNYFAKDIKKEIENITRGMSVVVTEDPSQQEGSYDALLLTKVLQLTLDNQGTINNRKLYIKVSVSAELVAPNGQVLYQRFLDYSSKKKSLSEWASLDVVTVRDMLIYMSNKLSQQIIDEFFVAPCPKPKEQNVY